jgi:hypothetical protein
MDVRQYGPALFPSLKQTRRILDEEALSFSPSGDDASAGDSNASPRDAGAGGERSGR